jgi:spore germination protein KC
VRKIKNIFLSLAIFLFVIASTACWNYREVDKLSIVAGVAIDKGVNDQYELTVEVIKISAGKETKMSSETYSAEGKTLFDAARNIVSVSGKKLYLSHTKVVIICEEIAREGVSKVLEWYNRDAETREDVHVLISKGACAKDIFKGKQTPEQIVSFLLDDALENENSFSKAPATDVLDYDIELNTKGASPVFSTVSLIQADDKMVPKIMGTAIINDDKLAGFLDGEETKDLLFIRDEIKGGVLTQEMYTNDEPTLISLEIFDNKTKVTPIVKDNEIQFDINIETTVGVDEISGPGNFLDEAGLKELERTAESTLIERTGSLIKKVQSEYDADIFRFSQTLWEDNAQVFNGIVDRWDDIFRNLTINIKSNVIIKNSAEFAKPVREGD